MNLIHLKEQIEILNEISVIGKTAVIQGTLCHIMGLVLKGSDLQMCILQYDETFRQRTEEQNLHLLTGQVRSLETNREYISDKRIIEFNNQFRIVRNIIIGDKEYEITASEFRQCDLRNPVCSVILTEFLRQEWKADGIDHRNIEDLHMTVLTLKGNYTAIPYMDYNETFNFRTGINNSSFIVEQPVTLKVGEAYPEKLWFAGKNHNERHWIQINRVYLYDMWTEMEKLYDNPEIREQLAPEQIEHSKKIFRQHLEEVCPKGNCYIIIEYESEEDMDLQFHSKLWLDSKPECSNSFIGMALIFKPDNPTGILGLKLKSAFIQEPVSPDTVSLEAELFKYIKSTDQGGMFQI